MNGNSDWNDRERNIILISVDSLRADFCPWLGYDGIATPTLESNAERGVSFKNAVAPGQGTPDSMPAIFTGYPRPDGSASEGTIEALTRVHQTIPEILQRAGYETIGFSSNPYATEKFGFDSGFDHFEDFTSGDARPLERVRSWVRSNSETKAAQGIRLLLNILGAGDLTVSWSDYYRDILSRVQSAEEPFFLWVFLMETHWPYVPSKAHRDGLTWSDFLANFVRSEGIGRDPTESHRTKLIELYERTILDVDDFVCELQQDMESYDPVYVFHSDHGESFGERGNWGHEGFLYDENVRVPLEIWGLDSNEDILAPVSLREMPTIINSISGGQADFWTAVTSPYVTSRLDSTECSLVGTNWLYYPAGRVTVPEELESLCEKPYTDANVRHSEYERIRSAIAGCVDTEQAL